MSGDINSSDDIEPVAELMRDGLTPGEALYAHLVIERGIDAGEAAKLTGRERSNVEITVGRAASKLGED